MFTFELLPLVIFMCFYEKGYRIQDTRNGIKHVRSELPD